MITKLNLSKSLAMQREAKQRIPGMTQLLSKRPDRFSLGVWPGYFQKAKGACVWDIDQNKYIDMSIGGVGANILGYADDDVDNAVIEAIKNGSSCTLNCQEEVLLAELLCNLHSWAEKVRYARTGGEAMAVAVRIARTHTGKDKIAFCGYHGWHDWYLSANLGTENALGEHLISGLDPAGVPAGLKDTAFPFRYNQLKDLESIIEKHGKDLAAVVMEPLRNFPPENGFVEGVRTMADECKAVLIVDEISAGFRLSTGGAHMKYFNDAPDIAVFSKALGNGYPMAAIIGRGEVMASAQKTFISSTNWTERVGPVAALAMIKKHKEQRVSEHLITVGQNVQRGWRNAFEKHGLSAEVYGIPPLSHFTFKYENHLSLQALFIELMLARGFLSSNSFYAMYAHTVEHVKAYLSAVDAAFRVIADAVHQKDAESRLTGLPAVAGFKRFN